MKEDSTFQALYSQMLDSIGEAVIATDIEGKIQYWNHAAKKLYQWDADEVLGRDILEITPTEATRQQAKEIMSNLRKGGTWAGELEVQRKDGSKFLALVNDSPILDDGGKLIGIIGVSQDITYRKNSEESQRGAHEAIRLQNTIFSAINRLFSESMFCESSYDVAQVCLSVAEDITTSQYGSVAEVNLNGRFDTLALTDPGMDECRIAALDPTCIQGMEIRGIWKDALESKHGLIINDPPNYPSSVGVPEGHIPLHSFLGVPIQHKDFFGMIGLANKEDGFSENDREIIEALALAYAELISSVRAKEALKSKIEDVERMNDLYVGREGRMIELKEEVNILLRDLGRPAKYDAPGQADQLIRRT